MNEPVRKEWSEEQLRVAALEFMRVRMGGLPDDKERRAQRLYLERVGLISFFVEWLWDTYTPETFQPDTAAEQKP